MDNAPDTMNNVSATSVELSPSQTSDIQKVQDSMPRLVARSTSTDLSPAEQCIGTTSGFLLDRSSANDIDAQQPTFDVQTPHDKHLMHDAMTIDVETNTDNKSGPTRKQKPETMISFHQELRLQDKIVPDAPQPADKIFSGAFDLNDQRVPIKEASVKREGELFIPANEPLWKQMLGYCNLWGVWAATIEDEKRRSELLDWVTRRMQGAWEFAIANGHCGEPNGHKHCCLAHEPTKKEVRKKPVDIARQPAPFASDVLKAPNAIINRELDQADITMDAILARTGPDNLEAGDHLLNDICERLGRCTLDVKDWTRIKVGRFDARHHSRNLLMFCLWEAQRCRGFVNNLEASLSKTTTSNQQRNLQKRIDVHRQRAEQHLTLAVMLNEKRPGESEAAESEDEMIAEQSKRPTRQSQKQQQLQAVVEVLSSEDDDQPIMDCSIDDRAVTPSLTDHEASSEVFEPMQEGVERHEGETDAEIKKAEVAEETAKHWTLPNIDQEAQDISVGNEFVGVKRGYIDTNEDARPQNKRVKLTNKAIATTDVPNYATGYPQKELESDSEQVFQRPAASPNHSAFTGISKQFLDSLHEHPILQTPVQESSDNDNVANDIESWKKEYTYQCWQPRINKLLAQNHTPLLNWKLSKWSDIKRILEDLEFSPAERNELLREYKAGFVEWRESYAQPEVEHAASQSDTDQHSLATASAQSLDSEVGSVPLEPVVKITNGFHVRMVSTATRRERKYVDNIIGEYIDYIKENDLPKSGYYVVFSVDKGDYKKELAHGIWDTPKSKHAKDAKWFYQNLQFPSNFRADQQIFYHDWGHSLAPPAARHKAKAPHSGIAKVEARVDYGRGTHGRNKPAPSRARGASNTSTRKRRNIIAESESDDEWTPNQF